MNEHTLDDQIPERLSKILERADNDPAVTAAEIKGRTREAEDADAAYIMAAIFNVFYESNRIYRREVFLTGHDVQNALRMSRTLIQIKIPTKVR